MSRPLSWPQSVRLYLVSFLIVGLSLSVLGPALTELRERSGADIGDIGVLFAGQSAGYIIGSFAGGRLYDRFDGHRVFAASLVLLGIGLALVPVVRRPQGPVLHLRRDRAWAPPSPTSGQHDADVGARRRFRAGDEHAPPVLRHRRPGGAARGAHRSRPRDSNGGGRRACCWRSGRIRVTAPSRHAEAREEHTDTTLPMLVPVVPVLLPVRRARDRLRRLDHDLRRGDRVQRPGGDVADDHVLDRVHVRSSAGERDRPPRAPRRDPVRGLGGLGAWRR